MQRVARASQGAPCRC